MLNKEFIDYPYLESVLYYGYKDENEELAGVEDIRNRYTIDYYQPDTNNITYEQKINTFLNEVLQTRINIGDTWHVKGNEVEFEFVYDDRVILHGFIDRLDENFAGDLRVVDYKTSKNIFPDAKIKTPMQMFIYDLACYSIYGKLPIRHEYDFIFINKKQTEKEGVCSSGYLKRGFKKLDSWLDKIDALREDDIYPPTPSPLCYWCEYSANTPNSDPVLNYLCQYYSLWTPDNKTYVVNKKFNPEKNNGKNTGAARHFVF